MSQHPFETERYHAIVTPRPVVLSIGGSVLAGEDLSAERFSRLTDRLDAHLDRPLGLVVGGGAAARRYIATGRELGLDESGLDELGITLTRANAWLLIAAFGERAYPKPAEGFEEAALALGSYPRVCMGGTHPGHTTDAVGAMLAERIRAERLVVVTNVDGVYTSDPAEDPKAERLDELTHGELVRLAGDAREAGSTTIVDPLAAQILQRSSMPGAVVSGESLDDVVGAAAGIGFDGTRIRTEG